MTTETFFQMNSAYSEKHVTVTCLICVRSLGDLSLSHTQAVKFKFRAYFPTFKHFWQKCEFSVLVKQVADGYWHFPCHRTKRSAKYSWR